jgi:hypothetical protein
VFIVLSLTPIGGVRTQHPTEVTQVIYNCKTLTHLIKMKMKKRNRRVEMNEEGELSGKRREQQPQQ